MYQLHNYTITAEKHHTHVRAADCSCTQVNACTSSMMNTLFLSFLFFFLKSCDITSTRRGGSDRDAPDPRGRTGARRRRRAAFKSWTLLYIHYTLFHTVFNELLHSTESRHSAATLLTRHPAHQRTQVSFLIFQKHNLGLFCSVLFFCLRVLYRNVPSFASSYLEPHY